MKKLILVIVALSGIYASAYTNEIPVAETDIKVNPTREYRCSDCIDLMAKKILCNGQEYAVHYNTGGGWDGTHLRSVCQWVHRSSAQACADDIEPGTLECFNKVVRFYNITRLVNAPATPPAQVQTDVPNMDNGPVQ
jgi:hypothetical protein